MYRLLFSELSRIFVPQSPVKIECVARALCTVPMDMLEYLHISDLKNILLSDGDNYETIVSKFLAVECPICSDSFPLSRIENMFLCEHVCCVDCIKRHYRVAIDAIQDPRSLATLTCYENHPLPEDLDERMNFFSCLQIKVRWREERYRRRDVGSAFLSS